MTLGLIIVYILGVGGVFIVTIQLPPYGSGVRGVISSFMVGLIWPFLVVAWAIMKMSRR